MLQSSRGTINAPRGPHKPGCIPLVRSSIYLTIKHFNGYNPVENNITEPNKE